MSESMDEMALLVDLHKQMYRQGPGGDQETELAVKLAEIDRTKPLQVADIGCGTGAPTLALARLLDAHITAVDALDDFLAVLDGRARGVGLSERISTVCASMEQLPLADEAYDVIWSEGAVYNMGFERGLREWRRFLKPQGILVVSEITWLSASRPQEIDTYWRGEYSEIDTASAKMELLERNGYLPLGYFTLPQHCWLDNYYRPLQESFPGFLARNGDSREAREIVAAEEREIEMYERFGAFYSYGVYIARTSP